MPMRQRFKSATFGFGITMAPIAVIACLQFLFASYTVKAVGGMDPAIEAWAVPYLRRELTKAHAIVVLTIAAYWLLVATLGRGRFLRIRSANIVLAFSGFAFAIAMVVATAVSIPARLGLFKGFCPALGLSDEMPDFGFDGRSPCEYFASDAVPIVFLGMPLILLIASAILRIVVSRRRGGAASAVPLQSPDSIKTRAGGLEMKGVIPAKAGTHEHDGLNDCRAVVPGVERWCSWVPASTGMTMKLQRNPEKLIEYGPQPPLALGALTEGGEEGGLLGSVDEALRAGRVGDLFHPRVWNRKWPCRKVAVWNRAALGRR